MAKKNNVSNLMSMQNAQTSVRKIDNGYITSTEVYDKSGYKRAEVFTKENPLKGVSSVVSGKSSQSKSSNNQKGKK